MIRGTRSAAGLNAVIQVLSLDLDLRQKEAAAVTDEFVLVRSEAQSDARRRNSLCPQHLIAEGKRFEALMMDSISSLTRRIQICSIVKIKHTRHSTSFPRLRNKYSDKLNHSFKVIWSHYAFLNPRTNLMSQVNESLHVAGVMIEGITLIRL